MISRKKKEAIAISAIIAISAFAIFVTAASNPASAPGPASGVNVTINETGGIAIRQPNAVNFTIQFNTTNQTDISNTTWFINITPVSISGVTIAGPSPNVTINDPLNATLTDYNTTFEINGTTDAVFNVTVINANNTNENATITGFTFDGTPPAVTIDTPTESSPVYKNGGALFFVNFTYSELNPKNYTVAIRNSTSVINSTTNSSVVGGTGLFANESFNLNSTAADGNYNVTVMMYNNVSLSYTAYQNYSVVNDNLAPQITSSSLQPSDGSTTTDTTPTISASYSDSGSGMRISSVIVTLDGTDVTASATVIASGVTYTPSTALSYATHTVSLSVADKATNTASKTWSFTVSSGRRGGRGVPRDSDGDGYSDVDEMLAGTNPNAPDDFPNKPETTPEPTPEPIAKPSPTVKPTAPLPAPAPTPTPTSEPTAATPTPEEPGFESVFAIAGLLAVAYLVRKLKK